MKRQRSRSEKISLGLSIAFHTIIVLLLVASFEKTIVVSAPSTEPNKPIIDAVMVSKKTLQEEVKRLEEKETKKRQQEEDRIKAIAQKEKEAKQKREKEEALAIELKKKNEALKKEAQEKKLAQEKLEKEQQAKLKQEQEELKKIQKAKEEALAEKKKAELEKKVAQEKVAEEKRQKEKELAEQKAKTEAEQKETEAAAQRVNPRVLQNEITRYALLMRNKIHQHWRQPIGFDFDNLSCKVEVKLLPSGDVVDAKVIESSGSLEFDKSAEVAIRKASPLPMPEDSNIAKEFRQFTFTFRPEAA